jgi:CubicO group peptidase (beta-lactamase class C family)
MRIAALSIAVAVAGCSAADQVVTCPEPAEVPAPEPPDPPVELREGFEVATRDPGLRAEALASFLQRAQAERSTSLLVAIDGRLVIEEYFGTDPDHPTIAMSVTKSIVALAIGILVDAGALELDAPLAETVLPEWRADERAKITLRDLMTHTSGLATTRYGQDDRWRTGSIEEHGLASSIAGTPGTFEYNNQAIDFLSVVVQRADPQHSYLDDVLAASLFAKMGIAGDAWMKDGHGQPRGAGELFMRPIDLLKIGQLVVQRGRWNDEQLVSEAWIDQMVAPMGRPDGPPMFYGLLWWLSGDDEVLAYRADGYLGQHIVVVPSAHLVAVRTRNPQVVGDDPEQFGWPDFVWDVLALAGHPVPQGERQAFLRAEATHAASLTP